MQKEEDILCKTNEIEECLRTSEARKLIILKKEKELNEIRLLNRELQEVTIGNFSTLKVIYNFIHLFISIGCL